METKLRVDLLSHTTSPLELIYASARQCYSGEAAYDIFDKARVLPDREMEVLIRKVIDSGHTSVAECVSFTFAVAGVSRALSHQLVRHRIASYSQQSQRYVDAGDFDHLVPPTIAANPEALKRFRSLMVNISDAYVALADEFDIPAEDARFVLPNACETKIVVTMNCRSLLHFFELRCCNRAQWEIRAMANEMLRLCRQALPVVFDAAGARCERLGYCSEIEKFRCGKMPGRN